MLDEHSDPARGTSPEPIERRDRWLVGRRAGGLPGGVLAVVAACAGSFVMWRLLVDRGLPASRGTAGVSASSGSGSGAGRAPAVPHFVDETATSGVDHRYEGDFPYFVGGGVATFDCNADGKPDLYVAGGTDTAALYRNESAVGGTLRFAAVPSPATDLASVTGAYPIDIDSDGTTDLVVLRNGAGNVVLRGLGDCRFEPANARFGVDDGADWTVGFSATWEGSSQLPTLAFGTYLRPGDDYQCDTSSLVRPAPGGTRYDRPLPLAPGYCALSMLFSDWSRTGRRDLRITNDRHYYTDGSEQLWRIAPSEEPRLYTAADGWRSLRIWGMGIASADVTGDGYPEMFLTSQGDNKLQTLLDGTVQPTFDDIALRRGVTAQRPYAGTDVLPSTAWHPAFADVNNDGLLDLFVTKGNVDAQPDHASNDPSDLLIAQPDGTFVERGSDAGIVRFDRARGASVTDLNLDGLLDLVVVNRRAPATIWRNVGDGTAARSAALGHWVAIHLHQPAPNVDAIGAWVAIRAGGRTTVREVTIGGGHASGDLGWLHLGLAGATTADVQVTWPDGTVGPWQRVRADAFWTVDRDAAAAVRWQPRR